MALAQCQNRRFTLFIFVFTFVFTMVVSCSWKFDETNENYSIPIEISSPRPRIFKMSWPANRLNHHYKIIKRKNDIESIVRDQVTENFFETELPLTNLDEINAQYFLEACYTTICTGDNPSSCGQTFCRREPQSVQPISILVKLVGYFKAASCSSNHSFGTSVSLSGDGSTMVVGAPLDDSSATGINGSESLGGANDSGAVYVFVKNGTTWAQQAYIKPSNTDAGDRFGSAVRISEDGNTIATTSPFEDSSAAGIDGNGLDNTLLQSGAVYVFYRNSGLWTQQAYVKPAFPGSPDNFGTQIDLSGNGNVLIVGASQEASNATGINGDQSNDAAGGTGAVYVFNRSGITWSQHTYIKPPVAASGDWFGYRAVISKDASTLAVASYYEDSGATGVGGDMNDGSVPNSGAVYIYVQSAGVWSFQEFIKATNPASNDEFGLGLGLSETGNILAVGAPSEDSNATGIDGNAADNSAANSGAIYLYSRAGTTWSFQNYIKASNTDAGDKFGSSVVVNNSGELIFSGSPSESSNAILINGDQDNDSLTNQGALYIFKKVNLAWSQSAYIKPSNSFGSEKNFASRIAISDDASTIAVTASTDGGSLCGITQPVQENYSLSGSGAIFIF